MKRNCSLLLVSILLLAGALACKAAGSLDPTGENALQTEAVAIVRAAGTQTELARPTATVTKTSTPRPTPTREATPGPVTIDDDFGTLDPRWQGCGVCTVQGGRLVMGPYAPSNSARCYTVLCKDCGIVR